MAKVSSRSLLTKDNFDDDGMKQQLQNRNDKFQFHFQKTQCTLKGKQKDDNVSREKFY